MAEFRAPYVIRFDRQPVSPWATPPGVADEWQAHVDAGRIGARARAASDATPDAAPDDAGAPAEVTPPA